MSRQISPELRQTVETHPNIKEVYFSVDGHHYFCAYDHKGDKYAMIAETSILDKGKPTLVKTPILKTKIVETLSREEVLGLEVKKTEGGEKKKGKKSE